LNLPFFIARRLSFTARKSFSRFILRLSVSATILSVAVMIVTLAFANGYQHTISQKVYNFFGHLRVLDYNNLQVSIAEELPVKKNDSVTRLPSIFPEITRVQAFATKNAILKTSETIEGVLFKGVEANYGFQELKPFLKEGRWISFTDSGYSSEINLSVSMAKSLNIKTGDAILIYFIQPNGENPRPRKLKVAGLYKTGIEEYDKLFAIGDLKLVQKLNGWSDNQIGGYEIFLKDPEQMNRLSEEILSSLPWGLYGQTIKEAFPSMFDWLAIQDQTIYMVMAIMIVIAVLNLITCLLILVLERTRMIGLLKALGGKASMIQQIFLYQGGIITFGGLLAGNLLGLGLCWLQQATGFIKIPEEFYYISEVAVYIEWWKVGLVNIFTFAICMLVLLLPTWIVKKVKPVKAIDFR
jgi:lipoprotein-releasing system permease protein